MPHCQSLQDDVDRLRTLLQQVDADCNRITDPTEARICRQMWASLAAQVARAEEALANCQAGLPRPGVRRAQGRLTFLRVHDSGGFGPQDDHLDSDVIFKLDTQPDRAFGFALRDDPGRPAHEGMLMLLRDALAYDFDVAADYRQVVNKANSVAFRIELTAGDRNGGPIIKPVVFRE